MTAGDDGPTVLVVDAANVVGSRPDGWWKDRPGAARRLHQALLGADLGADVVLVLEGAARSGSPEGDRSRVRTVHAPGSGDDAVVDEVTAAVTAGRAVTVVTADRGLVDRVRRAGAGCVGPSWLRDRLTW